MTRRKEIVIVGNGMATCRLLDELVARDAQERYDIAVVGEEAGGAYNRVMLSKVLEGAEPDAVITKPPSWYAEHSITCACAATPDLETTRWSWAAGCSDSKRRKS